MPLLDPRLQAAIKRFPELVMAGACLPDLAIVSPAFKHTHLWENAQQLISAAQSEEETAIAIGYASHLYIDVIAHNHFVPAHEAMWIENTMATHIAVEWAMDGHLAPLLTHSPRQLLTKHHHLIANFISPHFKCSHKRSQQALKKLAFWDGVLRFFRIPSLIYRSMHLWDNRVFKDFVYYIAKTQSAMTNINNVLTGQRPQWQPELNHLNKEEMADWRQQCLRHLDAQHPAPIEYFKGLKA